MRELDSARSSIDAATVRDDPGDGDDGVAVDEPAELEAGGDERLEPAALGVPMASVPVAPPPPAPSQPPAAPAPPRRRRAAQGGRVKALGDAAFRATLQRRSATTRRRCSVGRLRAAAAADAARLAPSNRAGTLAQLLRHEEALDDARAAVRLRPSWARAHSRVGAALLSLRRWDERAPRVVRGCRSTRAATSSAVVTPRRCARSARRRAARRRRRWQARGNDAFSAADYPAAQRPDAIAAAPADASL